MTTEDWDTLVARVIAGERAKDVARQAGVNARSLRAVANSRSGAARPLRLTDDEGRQYRTLKANGYTRREAFAAIRRAR